jgi:hypothetical protein
VRPRFSRSISSANPSSPCTTAAGRHPQRHSPLYHQPAGGSNNIARMTSTSPSPCMLLASASGARSRPSAKLQRRTWRRATPPSAAHLVTAFLRQHFAASQQQSQPQLRWSATQHISVFSVSVNRRISGSAYQLAATPGPTRQQSCGPLSGVPDRAAVLAAGPARACWPSGALLCGRS